MTLVNATFFLALVITVNAVKQRPAVGSPTLRNVEEQFSLNVGAVRFTEKYGLAGAISQEQVKVAEDAITSEFTRIDGRASPDALVGMGGQSPTSLP